MKIGPLFIARNLIESDGARMTDRKSEYFGIVWWGVRSAATGQRQTKGKINGIPAEFREVAADKCFRDSRALWWFLSNSSVNTLRRLSLKDRSFRFSLKWTFLRKSHHYPIIISEIQSVEQRYIYDGLRSIYYYNGKRGISIWNFFHIFFNQERDTWMFGF